MAVDPSQHADQRGWIESVLRYVPGFKGYLEKEYRRESDALARTHLADRLQAGKRNINQYQRSLLEAGRLDDLPALERTITAIDTLINRIQGDVRGYSGFFDFVQIQEDELDRVYQHDLQLISDVEAFARQAEALVPGRDEPRSVADQLQTQLDALSEKYSLRSKILSGLEAKQ
jgi:hypothetical protein